MAEVLWDKRRDDGGEEHRFVVLAAGMNDLLRPALYGARHRLVPLVPEGGPLTAADVVDPVCETSDTFASGELLPPLSRGDLDIGIGPFSPLSVPSPAMVGWAVGYVVVTLALALRLFRTRDL